MAQILRANSSLLTSYPLFQHGSLTPGDAHYHQPVDVTFIRADPVSKEERRRAYIRARRVIKYEQENGEEPVQAYVRNVQTFKVNELVRMKVEGNQAPAIMGRPRTWTQRWAEKDTVLGPVEGHPDQYWIRRSTTGRVASCDL